MTTSFNKGAFNQAAGVCGVCLALLSPTLGQAQDDRSALTLDLGHGVTVTPYGYVKADFIWDDGYDLGNTTGPLKSIGVTGSPSPAAGRFDTQTLRESRIGFEVEGPDIYARFEGDFYGPDGTLRLRHAYVQSMGFLIGQNWTNFMSVEALADTVDFTGAGGLPFARTPQVRYTFPIGSDVSVSAAVEEDISEDDQYVYTLSARYGFEQGMMRASAIYRDSTIDGVPVKGHGVSLTTVVTPWNGGTIKANLMTGDGIADYLSSGWVIGDFSVGAFTGRVDAAVLSVTQQVNDKLLIAATGSYSSFRDSMGSDTRVLEGLHLSAFYDIAKNTTLMGEVFLGSREQANGARFSTNRLQMAIKYAF